MAMMCTAELYQIDMFGQELRLNTRAAARVAQIAGSENTSCAHSQGEFVLPIILTRIKELRRDAEQHQPFPV